MIFMKTVWFWFNTQGGVIKGRDLKCGFLIKPSFYAFISHFGGIIMVRKYWFGK